jgi:hypothetical protein
MSSNTVIQDTFNQYTGDAYAGMVHDPMDLDIVTRINTGLDANDANHALDGIPFGTGVQRAVNNPATGCSIPAAATTAPQFMGVAIRSVAIPEKAQTGNTTPTYDRYEEVGILDSGRIWCTAVNAAVAGDPVFLITASSTPAEVGRFASSAGSFTAVLELKMAQWESTCGAGGLGIINFDGSNAFVS